MSQVVSVHSRITRNQWRDWVQKNLRSATILSGNVCKRICEAARKLDGMEPDGLCYEVGVDLSDSGISKIAEVLGKYHSTYFAFLGDSSLPLVVTVQAGDFVSLMNESLAREGVLSLSFDENRASLLIVLPNTDDTDDEALFIARGQARGMIGEFERELPGGSRFDGN